MKAILIIAFCIFTTRLVNAELDPAAIMQDMEVCKNDTKMSDDEFSGLMAQQMPESPEGKCFIFCMMRSMTLMSEEGELNTQGFSALIAEAPVDDEQKEKMKDIPEECSKDVQVVKEDPCETSHRVALCFKKKAEEKGIEAPV